MSAYIFFKDFAGPISTAIAAFTAAGVTGVFAYRQWRTSQIQAEIALDKLKLETYADRMRILDAAKTLMRLVVNIPPGEIPPQIEMQEQRRIIDNARFLFSTELRDYLDEIVSTCYKVPNYSPFSAGRRLSPEEHKELIERGTAMKKVVAEMQRLPIVLEEDISLNFLRNTPSISVGSKHNIEAKYTPIIFLCYIIIALIGGLAISLLGLAVSAVSVVPT